MNHLTPDELIDALITESQAAQLAAMERTS